MDQSPQLLLLRLQSQKRGADEQLKAGNLRDAIDRSDSMLAMRCVLPAKQNVNGAI